MNPFRSLGLLGWIAVAAVAIVLVGTALYFAGGGARRETAAAKSETALAASRAASGSEATETIAAGAVRDGATDQLTQETAHAIDSAPGARAPVDPAVSHAGLVGLCRRAAYRSRPECVQLLGPEEPSGAGSRR